MFSLAFLLPSSFSFPLCFLFFFFPFSFYSFHLPGLACDLLPGLVCDLIPGLVYDLLPLAVSVSLNA